jgi:cell division protein DivIC
LRRLFLLFSPGRLVLAASLVIVAYLLVSAGGNVLQSFRIADDEARLQAQVDELHRRERELEQIREYLRTDEYVEFIARRVFGLVRPGETLVVITSTAPAPEGPEEVTPGRPWWERVFGR